MTSIVLEYPRKDAKTLIKAALEITQGIKQYHDAGNQIVAKTGWGLSYGEQVTIEFPETRSNDNETEISIEAEKDVSTDIMADPQRYESRFLEQLDLMRGSDVEEVMEIMNRHINLEDSKEVDQANELRGDKTGMIVYGVLLTILGLLWIIIP